MWASLPLALTIFYFFIGCEAKDAELYTLVAQKLDHLVKQQQQVLSPVAVNGLPSPIASSQISVLPTETASQTSGTRFIYLHFKSYQKIGYC